MLLASQLKLPSRSYRASYRGSVSQSQHRIWPGEGSTVQWQWSPPSPGCLKALLFPPLLNKVENKGTQGVRARYGAELPPFISIVRYPGRPVILGMENHALKRHQAQTVIFYVCVCLPKTVQDWTFVKCCRWRQHDFQTTPKPTYNVATALICFLFVFCSSRQG